MKTDLNIYALTDNTVNIKPHPAKLLYKTHIQQLHGVKLVAFQAASPFQSLATHQTAPIKVVLRRDTPRSGLCNRRI